MPHRPWRASPSGAACVVPEQSEVIEALTVLSVSLATPPAIWIIAALNGPMEFPRLFPDDSVVLSVESLGLYSRPGILAPCAKRRPRRRRFARS